MLDTVVLLIPAENGAQLSYSIIMLGILPEVSLRSSGKVYTWGLDQRKTRLS